MALACSWGGFADTDVSFSEFFSADHTVAVRFMLQYPHAYTGPMLAVNGSGTYLIGQGDFLNDAPGNQIKLVMQIGTAQVRHAVALSAGFWHHLAVVRSGNVFKTYLDGQPVGASLNLPASGLPAGRLRLGKTRFDPLLDGGGAQFFGLLDDVAIFRSALPASRIAELANALRLSGGERDLHAGYVFGYVPPGGLPATLRRPLTLTPAATLVPASANRNSAMDARQLPLSLTGPMHLPFPSGQSWYVIQGYDNPNGSHKGYASFALDLILAGKPQSASKGARLYAAAPGTVDFVTDDAASGGQTNFLTVRQDPHEFCDYLHLDQNSAQVNDGDRVASGQHLANVGDTGADLGAYHLHLAITNLGEANKNAGGAFVTVPAPFDNYEASDDGGVTWRHVLRGIPQRGQWLRQPVTSSRVRYTAVWRPSSEGEIHVYGWTYEDLRARYDVLWPQGWRLKLLAVHAV